MRLHGTGPSDHESDAEVAAKKTVAAMLSWQTKSSRPPLWLSPYLTAPRRASAFFSPDGVLPPLAARGGGLVKRLLLSQLHRLYAEATCPPGRAALADREVCLLGGYLPVRAALVQLPMLPSTCLPCREAKLCCRQPAVRPAPPLAAKESLRSPSRGNWSGEVMLP